MKKNADFEEFQPYNEGIKNYIKTTFNSLSEKDRRLYSNSRLKPECPKVGDYGIGLS